VFLQAKIQKYLTRPEAEKYVKQKQRAQSKARAEELELPSGRQIADARKAEQRLRVTQEFFASVFQRDDGGYLHQTADEELEVTDFLCCLLHDDLKLL
jgi:hypothetical protein